MSTGEQRHVKQWGVTLKRLTHPIVRVVRFVPLSLAMMLATTVSAVATGAITGQTSPELVQRWGFSLDHLRDGRIWTIFTGDWLVYDVTHWASMLLLFALFAVPLEAIGGTWLLAAAFWLGSPGGTILTSVLSQSLGGLLDWDPQPNLISEADIGGSVGTWSAAGALLILLAHQPRWLLWTARVGVAAYIGQRLVVNHDTADVAHLVGLLIGIGVGLCWTLHREIPTRVEVAGALFGPLGQNRRL